MAETKFCPSCGLEVPLVADRCKACFHDFAAAPKRNWFGPVLVLGAVAFTTLIAAVLFVAVAMMPTDQRILVDESTKSIVFTTKYRTHVSTERLEFSDVVKVIHVTDGGEYRIEVIDDNGARRTIMTSNEPLTVPAAKYAQLMSKPYETEGDAVSEGAPQ